MCSMYAASSWGLQVHRARFLLQACWAASLTYSLGTVCVVCVHAMTKASGLRECGACHPVVVMSRRRHVALFRRLDGFPAQL
jgi:hypothetical protein